MIIPYLTFQGDCEEALRLYADAFGGKVEHLSRYTEATGGAAMAGKVMHAHLSVPGGALSAADQEEPVAHTEAMKLLVHCATSEEANRRVAALAEGGGQVIQRLTPHPPPDDGGMGALVRDRYGYIWILTAPNDNRA